MVRRPCRTKPISRLWISACGLQAEELSRGQPAFPRASCTNKPNFRRCRVGQGQGNVCRGCCTNKPNLGCPAARRGTVANKQSQSAGDVARGTRRGSCTNKANFPPLPGRLWPRGRGMPGERRQTNPICQPARWDQRNLSRQTKPIARWKVSARTPNPRSGRGQAPRSAEGQSCETKPIGGTEYPSIPLCHHSNVPVPATPGGTGARSFKRGFGGDR